MNLQAVLDFTEWYKILEGVGTFGILILVSWLLFKENGKTKMDLAAERNSRIDDLKKHNENSEGLLERVLVALQDNQKFLSDNFDAFKKDIVTKIDALAQKYNKE